MYKHVEYEVFPIGQIKRNNNGQCIRVDKEYREGIKYLSLFSHAIIIYANPSGHLNAFGQPNVFLQHTVKIISIDEHEGVVNLNSMPYLGEEDFVYDIKPYFPCEDRVKVCTMPKDSTAHSIEETEYRESSSKKKEVKAETPLNQKICPIGEIRKIEGKYFIELFQGVNLYFEKLKGYSHIKIFWWFHRFDKKKYRSITQCEPPYENAPRTGVFATRSPVRPNPIGLTTARILNFDTTLARIEVSPLDCFDHTPLVAVVPYMSFKDSVDKVKVPNWLEHWPEWLDDKETKNIEKQLTLKASSLEKLKKYIHCNDKIVQGIKGEDVPTHIKLHDLKVNKKEGIVIKGARENNLKNIEVTIPYHAITVVTGVSGSGKSSLVFDTLFAESQRRFIDSRGVSNSLLGEKMEKPDFDSLEGLPPAIAIAQKTLVKNPRSTVGTMTDLYGYIRTLFASIGVRYCPECQEAIVPLSADEIATKLLELPLDTRIEIMPFQMDTPSYESVIDKKSTTEEKIFCFVRMALERGKGAIHVAINGGEPLLFQTTQMCYHCHHILFELTPGTFNFNDAESMCPICNGLGIKMEVDPDLIVSHPHLSLLEGASTWWGNLRKFREKPNANWMKGEVLALAESMQIDLEKPWDELPEAFRTQAIWGSKGKEVTFIYKNEKGRSGNIIRPVEGAYHYIKRLFLNSTNEGKKSIINEFMTQSECEGCHGERLSKEGRLVSIANTRFPQVAGMTIEALAKWTQAIKNQLVEDELLIAMPLLEALYKKLESYRQVGLSYLPLDRPAPTLSGGELQRLRLITMLNSDMTNMLYILDEPSSGLHPKDYKKIINCIKALRDRGNTIVVVEHNKDMMEMADYIIDIGPKAGVYGGEIVAQGSLTQIMEDETSLTGNYLSSKKEVVAKKKKICDKTSWIQLYGARGNNLKNIDITFPTGAITCITGVSGSGKSSLVSGVLYPALKARLDGKKDIKRYCDALIGDAYFTQILYMNQDPIGRSPRSNPATYTGLMDEIRKLFAHTEKAKEKGYTTSHFSFNSKEGQCQACHGEGRKCHPVSFMEDIWTTCPVCKGKRYVKSILEVTYKDKNIHDILQMNVSEALDLFNDQLKIKSILTTLSEVGLNYIQLGQSATTLSGGEDQRIKLSKQLSINTKASALYILDEPTTGLHFSDIQNLLICLRKITDAGNSVVIIEHNLDMIRNADWIIDLGPEGGDAGGYVMAQGTLEEIAKVEKGYTGKLFNKAIINSAIKGL